MKWLLELRQYRQLSANCSNPTDRQTDTRRWQPGPKALAARLAAQPATREWADSKSERPMFYPGSPRARVSRKGVAFRLGPRIEGAAAMKRPGRRA